MAQGNTHTHTLKSDGDSTPEEVVRWYREHGYDFLVIHDRITIADGGGMVMIPGEEVTDLLPKKPLHVNAIGITKAVAPQKGATVVENLQETNGSTATYEFRGDEVYVRAKVIDSNGKAAWMQPRFRR